MKFPILYCYRLQMFLKSDKRQDITSIITNVLNTSCNCQRGNVSDTRLTCSNESLNSVVYQALLSGTDSGALVSVLEEWIDATPTVHVQGVLVRVGGGCAVNVTDLSSDICSESNEPSTCNVTQTEPTDQRDQTEKTESGSDSCIDMGLVLGTAAAVVVGVVLPASVIIIITCCILKRKRRPRHSYSLKRPSEE